MELTMTADQDALVDAFGGFFAKESLPSVVRAAEPLGFDPELWAKAVDMGIPAMATPEANGGGGASMLELALVAELVGRHLVPIPFVETIVATRLLAATGEEEWLRRAHDGAVVTLATGRLVPAGAVAEAVLTFDDNELALVEGQAPPLGNMASAPLATLPGDGTRRVLASGAEAAAVHARALDEWRSLAASVLSGLASAALEIGVAYVKQREQFGKPIGAFQSIAHRLADDATAVQGLELLSRKAAWALDDEPAAAHRLASMAYLWGGEVANTVAGDSLHFHGGYGFMLEYDIQLHYRRAKLWSVLLGDPRDGYAYLGRELFR